MRNRFTLFTLQVLVAVVLIAIWHFGSTVKVSIPALSPKPFYPLDPFFFSTPLAVLSARSRTSTRG
jgi:NitT/TauT family transport system permease protein